jgi:hypothetical protein
MTAPHAFRQGGQMACGAFTAAFLEEIAPSD